METQFKAEIQKKYTGLLKKLQITPNLLDLLVQYNVFDKKDVEYVNKFTGMDKTRYFFIELAKQGHGAFLNFMVVLKILKQEEIVNILDPKNNYNTGGKPVSSEPFALPNEPSPILDNDTFYTPLKINVITSKEILPKNDDLPSYSTKSKNRGYVLIINVLQVIRKTERIGSLEDVRKLTDLFNQCGLSVLPVAENPTAQQIKREITNFVNDVRLKEADSVFVFVMSHGSLGERGELIFGSDGNLVYTSWIEDQFSNDVCAYMHHKPKILVFQACRGDSKDRGIFKSVETDGIPPDLKIVAQSDIIIVHSTLKNFVSHRDLQMGTWYIHFFCKVFMQYAKDKHVEDLLKLINESLSKQRTSDDDRQTSEYINRHFKIMYLNPGIYLQNGCIRNFCRDTNANLP